MNVPTRLLCAGAMLLCGACGSSGGDATVVTIPDEVLTRQEAISEADWQGHVNAISGLAGLVDAQKGTPMRAAGILESDKGKRLVWAEYAVDGAARTDIVSVYGYCADTSTCTAGTARYTAEGAEIRDAAGAEVQQLIVATPRLLKMVPKQNVNDATVLVTGALNRAALVEAKNVDGDLSRVAFGQRRMIVACVGGPQTGWDVAPIASAGQQSGYFDEVLTRYFVREDDVKAMLSSLTAIDVFVWVTQGVQMKIPSQNATYGIGVTGSLGVFGDATMTRDEAAKLLDGAPLHGPGLILLVGGNTAVSAGLKDKENAQFAAQWPDQGRVVVGFDGNASLPMALGAGAAFIATLAKPGGTLAAAKGAATTAGKTFSAVASVDDKVAESWKLEPPVAQYWEAGTPSATSLTINVTSAPACVEIPQGETCAPEVISQYQQIPASNLKPLSAKFTGKNVTWTGPFFHQKEDNGVAIFEVWGLALRREPGAYFYFLVRGSSSTLVKDATFIGMGQFSTDAKEKPDVGGGSTKYFFRGFAVSGTYRDGNDYCCVGKSPLLASSLNEPGILIISK